MHWGHAVSEDLVHWEHLPIALYPDSLGYIFSGSAVVDWNNTSGLGQNGQAPLIAIFTHHDPNGDKEGRIDFQYQSIAYSNDKGRTWTKYEGNPVVPNPGIRDFRDPKVIWVEEYKQWIMVFAAQNHVKFYSSPNLRDWTHLSDFGETKGSHGGVWECPDLFPIQVEGTDETKWVLLLSINPGSVNGGSGTQYFVGTFDGKNFTLDEEFANDVMDEKAVWLDYGRDNYAGVTWSDIPESDGRRIFLGWMSNWDYAQVVPTEKWRSAMTVPRTLQLHHTPIGPRLYSYPVKELETLRSKEQSIEAQVVKGELKLDTDPAQLELLLEIEIADAESNFEIVLSNDQGESYKMGFDAAANQLYSDRRNAGKHDFSEKFAAKVHTAPRNSVESALKLHLILDQSSAELFVDDGLTVLTDLFYPSEKFNQISIISENGVSMKSGKIYSLNQIWR
jgi:fructan beta-fructosidase